MIDALFLLGELISFGLLLFALRCASQRGQRKNLGLFAYRESLTEKQTSRGKKIKGDLNA
ncbi:MAG: hypothetical protein V4713_09170 [Pseudomonadota bacterium]